MARIDSQCSNKTSKIHILHDPHENIHSSVRVIDLIILIESLTGIAIGTDEVQVKPSEQELAGDT